MKDLASEFLIFEEQTRALPDELKLEQLDSLAYRDDPYYLFKREKWKREGVDPDAQVLEELRAFPNVREAFVRVQRTFPEQLQTGLVTFAAAFPDFDANVNATLLHSLGEMNGGVREIAREKRLIFGADMIAHYHTWENNQPFVHHELTHVYLAQLQARAEAPWYGADTICKYLFNEGLAVFVSAKLNPQATNDELMLEIPQGLPEATRQHRAKVAGALLECLASENPADEAKFFLFASEDPTIPKRCGYVIGFWLVRTMHQRISLQEMIRFSSDILLGKIEEELRSLAE